MGRFQAEQPLLGKEGVGPASFVVPMTTDQTPPLTPCSRAVNLRSVQTEGSAHSQRERTSPTCLAFGTGVGLASIGWLLTPPPSCTTMGALTPAGTGSAGIASAVSLRAAPTRTAGPVAYRMARPLRHFVPEARVPKSGRSPLFTTTNLLTIPSPTPCCLPGGFWSGVFPPG